MASNGSSSAPVGTGRLQDKVAIITGAAGGIGRAIAIRYAAEGAYVVCAKPQDYDGKPTHEVINELYPATAGAKSSKRAIFVKVDVTVSAEQENLIKECIREYGRLDIMVNDAGIAFNGLHPPGMRIHEIPESAFDKIIAVNLKGVWLGCKYAAAQMLAQEPHPSGDRGWIINTASVIGLVGQATASEYSASKGGVVNLTKTVALEYAADRIHVNALAPGFTDTNIIDWITHPQSERAVQAQKNLIAAHPFGPRLGTPDDIAGAAVFLASADASWVTGHILAVDGGYLAR